MIDNRSYSLGTFYLTKDLWSDPGSLVSANFDFLYFAPKRELLLFIFLFKVAYSPILSPCPHRDINRRPFS